jgi:WD40 repeat protein
VEVLTGHNGWVNSVAWSGRFLASGSWDNTIRIWDSQADFACVKVITGHTNWVNSIVWSSCGRFLASGSGDKTIRILSLPHSINYDYNTREPYEMLFGNRGLLSASSLAIFKVLCDLFPVELAILMTT